MSAVSVVGTQPLVDCTSEGASPPIPPPLPPLPSSRVRRGSSAVQSTVCGHELEECESPYCLGVRDESYVCMRCGVCKTHDVRRVCRKPSGEKLVEPTLVGDKVVA